MRAAAFLLVALVWLSPGILHSERQAPKPDGAYLSAVRAYAACRDEEAFRTIQSVTASYKMALEEVAPRASLTELGAALLLHVRLSGLPGDGRWEHEMVVPHAAERLLASGPPPAVGGAVYGLLVIELQDQQRFTRALQVLARMREPYREQPVALLATASLHELLSTPMVAPDTLVLRDEPLVGAPHPAPPLDQWGRDLFATAGRGIRANRNRAIELYREVTTRWPSDAESCLRLAFLLTEDGRLEEADAVLAGARPLAKPPVLAGYESLIAGRLAERRSRPGDAVAEYMRAAAIAPRAQTPLLAAARLLFLQGEAASARQLLAARLPSTSADQSADPWWQMTFGQTWRHREYVQRLNALIRPCAQ
jgi:tetratricopeptide (TPR) repeat protein